MLAAGRDATEAFSSYHPFTRKPREMLVKYHIGRLSTHEHPTYSPDTHGFYDELKAEVISHVSTKHLHSCVINITEYIKLSRRKNQNLRFH